MQLLEIFHVVTLADLQVGDVDLVLRAADEGGELLAAEHPQPVQPYHVTHASSEMRVQVMKGNLRR